MFHEIPKNCRYGYARVSSKSEDMQVINTDGKVKEGLSHKSSSH